jgi:RNA polymerase sigma-70 factor (ECF subfamily)
MLGPRFEDLLERAQSGDPLAFGELWRDAQPMLLRYLRVLAGTDAEDVASVTWMRVIERLGDFSGSEAGFRRWLVTVARNHHIDQVRASARRRVDLIDDLQSLDVDGAAPDPADLIAAKMSTQSALELIGRLPHPQAELIMLRVVMGLDVADVAEVTGRTPGAVRVAVHRALRRLEAILAADLVGVTGGDTRSFS